MGANSVRSGPAVGPDIVIAAGTDNDSTDPKVVGFTVGVRPCLVSVPGTFTSAIRCKMNALAANDFDNDGDDDGTGYVTIAVGSHEDLSIGGRILVDKVSFVTQNAGDDLDLVSVVGWR